MFGRLIGFVFRVTKPLLAIVNDDARCCICLMSYRVAGPFVECQPDVLLCEKCIVQCQKVLDDDKRRRGLIPPITVETVEAATGELQPSNESTASDRPQPSEN